MLNRNFIVFDLECTCWGEENPLRKEQPRISEIIEIGAVLVHQPKFGVSQTLEEFDVLIRPVQYPKLSNFCTELTTITQEQVDDAPLFREAWSRFLNWAGKFDDPLLVSWGQYDHTRVNLETVRNEALNPWVDKSSHINLKEIFSRQMRRNKKSGKGRGLSKALSEIGISFEGTHHRGIDDAKMTAKIFSWLYSVERLTPKMEVLYSLYLRSGKPLTRKEVLDLFGDLHTLPSLEAEARDLKLGVFG